MKDLVFKLKETTKVVCDQYQGTESRSFQSDRNVCPMNHLFQATERPNLDSQKRTTMQQHRQADGVNVVQTPTNNGHGKKLKEHKEEIQIMLFSNF